MAFQNADTRLTEVRKENWFDKYLLSFHYQLFSKRVLVSHVHAVCARNCIIFHRRQRSHDFHCVKSRAVLTNAVSPGVNLSGSGVSLHIHKSNTHTYLCTRPHTHAAHTNSQAHRHHSTTNSKKKHVELNWVVACNTNCMQIYWQYFSFFSNISYIVFRRFRNK